MLIEGNMSFGVPTIATKPAIKIRIAKTVKVYGRRSANATIHGFRLGYATIGLAVCMILSCIPSLLVVPPFSLFPPERLEIDQRRLNLSNCLATPEGEFARERGGHGEDYLQQKARSEFYD
jgi:hypothetical protein